MKKEFFAFTYENHVYSVNLSSKKSREDCQTRINHNTGKKFKWFKESTGKKNWVLYDSEMYKVYCGSFSTHYDIILHYIGKDFKPEMPINASSCRGMFSLYSHLPRSGTVLDFSNFNTVNIVDMSFMFSGFYGSEHLDCSMLDTSNVIDMTGMFSDCTGLLSINLVNFDMSKVISVAGMFSRCYNLIEINLSSFDLSNVRNAHYMFYGCKGLRSIKMPVNSNFAPETADSMFSKCHKTCELNLICFDTENLISINFMFFECRALTKIFVSNKWNYIDYNESVDTFYMCNDLTNYDSNRLNGEMAKFVEQGGYLTLIKKGA